ncbi:hypothetical protein RBG07_25735 [Klebsiella aerogenes]|uniref:hypothetical protein n=1 Tax=Klebsiella aerogenes TaxID=548 RepID=UPI0028DEB97B|nr:hypothetical protein [Klebsiella aerogenes]MDT8885909.1 hypothetical protein [Klebsiella aerogenes]
MTDKTPRNKADIPVKTPTASAGTGTTDATRNSGPKSRALPEAGALKDRFKAGSIPLQTDFADLIDLANMGRQAVGGAEGQTGPANGFTLSSMGRLELKPNTEKGISVDKDGVSVNAGNGIQIDSQGVSIKLATNSGLSTDQANGLKIVPEQMFHKGMVMMFAGTATEIPKGWALCDGSPGTPNLIDRFILGSKPADSGKFNSATLTGSGNTKAYSKESSSETVSGTISIGSTTLNKNQIPSHTHIGGMPYRFAYNNGYGSTGVSGHASINDVGSFYTSDPNPFAAYTSSTGGGEGHTHTGTMSTTAHKHTTDVIPPYYTLAFIIKL